MPMRVKNGPDNPLIKGFKFQNLSIVHIAFVIGKYAEDFGQTNFCDGVFSVGKIFCKEESFQEKFYKGAGKLLVFFYIVSF